MTINTSAKCVAICASLFMAGCGSTIHTIAKVDGIDTLSVDAKQRLVTVSNNAGPNADRRVVCSEPSPDALVASAASLAGQGSAPNSASAKLSASFNEAAASIGLRTQPIQLMRDGYFRMCEAYMNGALSKKEYKGVIRNLDTFLTVVMALDALGGSKAAPAVTISPGGTAAKTNADGTEAATTAGTTNINNFNAGQGATIGKDQALAITNIARSYLAHKRYVLRNFHSR